MKNGDKQQFCFLNYGFQKEKENSSKVTFPFKRGISRIYIYLGTVN